MKGWAMPAVIALSMLAYAGMFLSAVVFGMRTRWSFAMMAVPVLFLCGAAVKMFIEREEPRFRVPRAIAAVLLSGQIVLLSYRVGLSLTVEHGGRARSTGWADPQWMYSMLWIMVVGYCLLLVYVLFTAIEMHSHVARSAGLDALTGSMNRRALLKHVALEEERSEKMGRPLAVICVDLDHFKRVNDTYGHGGGDAVLCAFVSLVKERLRGEDVVARTGGEEFVVVLPGMDRAMAAALAERVRLDVEQMRVGYEGRVISTTVSAGVTERLGPEDCWASMTKRADRLLYQAKSSGRNRVVVEEPAAMLRFIAARECADEKATVG